MLFVSIRDAPPLELLIYEERLFVEDKPKPLLVVPPPGLPEPN
jgi:hypothetical protein